MSTRKMFGVATAWAILLCTAIVSGISALSSDRKTIAIEFEKYVLPNGLEVVLHEDHSDPIVAVATIIHVGSSREKPGRTGFAHFFEHMSFNDSENVPRGANRKMIPELGGSRNGGTSTDFTVYYEVVPVDAYEKILWIASDRLGFMINTVTEAALEREKQVVKNEKRQRCDNAPYGFTDEVQRAALYPEGHPYSRPIIGSLPDLQAATLEDVKEFYFEYYGANNATLVIAGDISIEETKELVDRWFGEIRRCRSGDVPQARPAPLEATHSLYHLDNFAKLAELQSVYPAVPVFHEDSYALNVLADALAGSKKAPLYRVLVEERKLAPEVVAYLNAAEIAGEFYISVRANAGTDLDDVARAIDEALARFEKEGISEKDLMRIKAQREISLYNGIATLESKAFQLALYNEFAGDPGYIAVEAQRTAAVTADDVMRVYETYIKGKHRVMTSFVPKDQPDLAVAGAMEAPVWKEDVSSTAEHEQVSQGEEAVYEKTATKYDRSEPSLGGAPLLKSPRIWAAKLDNGMAVYGIEHAEVPLVNFGIVMRGGHWCDPPGKSGTAALAAALMMEGTKRRTPAELEEAIGLLGASIDFYAFDEEILVFGTTLSKNFDAAMELLTEMILEPRWDEREFERLKLEQLTALKDGESNSGTIAATATRRLLYGSGHILGTPVSGTPETVESITFEDVKEYCRRNFSPSISGFAVVGDVGRKQVLASLERLEKKWKKKAAAFPTYALPAQSGGKSYFIDMPGASQSQIAVFSIALSAVDEDYNNLAYANEVLGGGSSGRLFQLLRIEKGFTYGAYSFVQNGIEKQPFVIRTSVRTNATEESLRLIQDLLRTYEATFGESEMEITKNKVIKGNTRAFESLNARFGMLRNIIKFGMPLDYIEQNQQELIAMTLDDFHRMIREFLDEGEMKYLVVGDAESQLKSVETLGYGPAAMLDVYGNAPGATADLKR